MGSNYFAFAISKLANNKARIGGNCIGGRFAPGLVEIAVVGLTYPVSALETSQYADIRHTYQGPTFGLLFDTMPMG